MRSRASRATRGGRAHPARPEAARTWRRTRRPPPRARRAGPASSPSSPSPPGRGRRARRPRPRDVDVEPVVEPLDGAHRGARRAGAVAGPDVVGGVDALRVDLPGRDLVGIEVDRRVRPDVDVAPDARGRLGQAVHRADDPLVRALEPVARRLLAQRRLEPHVAVADLDRVVLVVEQPHQARVGDRDVVALEVVVGHDLPVGRLRGRGGVAERLEPLDPVRRELLAEAGERRRERRGVGVEVDEHEPVEHLDARRHQTERRLVEAREPAPLRHADQAARRCR